MKRSLIEQKKQRLKEERNAAGTEGDSERMRRTRSSGAVDEVGVVMVNIDRKASGGYWGRRRLGKKAAASVVSRANSDSSSVVSSAKTSSILPDVIKPRQTKKRSSRRSRSSSQAMLESLQIKIDEPVAEHADEAQRKEAARAATNQTNTSTTSIEAAREVRFTGLPKKTPQAKRKTGRRRSSVRNSGSSAAASGLGASSRSSMSREDQEAEDEEVEVIHEIEEKQGDGSSKSKLDLLDTFILSRFGSVKDMENDMFDEDEYI